MFDDVMNFFKRKKKEGVKYSSTINVLVTSKLYIKKKSQIFFQMHLQLI